MTNALFGGKPKRPKQEVIGPGQQIQQIQQSATVDEVTRKNLAKRRRATQLNQVTAEANISRKKLGAG